MDADGNLSKDELRHAAEGLAAIAISLFEMGVDVQPSRTQILNTWASLGSPPGMFTAAAASISEMPQPLLESVSKSHRMDPIRESIGVTLPSAQLEAMLRARELLQSLAIQET